MLDMVPFQRCVARLKKSRDTFLERFRGTNKSESSCDGSSTSMVRDLMIEEWKQLSHEHKQLPTIREGSQGLDVRDFF